MLCSIAVCLALWGCLLARGKGPLSVLHGVTCSSFLPPMAEQASQAASGEHALSCAPEKVRPAWASVSLCSSVHDSLHPWPYPRSFPGVPLWTQASGSSPWGPGLAPADDFGIEGFVSVGGPQA